MDGGHSKTKGVDEWSRRGVGQGHEYFSSSYTVRSVPGASLAVFGAVRVWGQAAAGVRVVGGRVRGPL